MSFRKNITCQPWMFLALLLLSAHLLPAQKQADVVMRAMKDELSRSMGQLQLQQMDKPYFLGYRLEDIMQREISATLGSLTTSSGDPFRNRMIGVELRVGDYSFDNTNFFSIQRLRSGATSMFFSGIDQAAMDDDYAQLRREFWMATDKQYKRALEDLSAKRAALKMRNGGENIPDFSKEPVVSFNEPSPVLSFRSGDIESLARDLSGVFRSTPEIDHSSVTIKYRSVYTRYVNSEGTLFTRTEPIIQLQVTASTQAEDGVVVSDSFVVYGHSASDLPSKESLLARTLQMASGIQKQHAVSSLDRYNGPVLFEGPAAGELFLQQFGSRLTASRAPVSDNPQFEMFFTQMLDRMLGASFQDKIGARVLPEFMSVSDEPGEKVFGGSPLMGTAPIDDEGVKTRETLLVQRGILKNLLAARTPVHGISQSTGSRRGWGAVPSNLFVKSEKTMGAEQLRQELLRRAKDRGLDFAIVIRRLGGGAQTSFMEMARAMTNQGSSQSLSEVYKIYADGHEEPVRGVHIVEMPSESFKEIAVTGDTPALYSDELIPRMGALFAMGLSSGNDLPVVSCVVPSMLFEEVSLAKVEGPFPAKPITPSPLAEK
jgi:predicted Zn-dependent protease